MRKNRNIDFLKKPVITEKATKFIEQKQYIFDVHPKLTKTQMKKILQSYYGKKIKSIRTQRKCLQKRVFVRFFSDIQIYENVQNNQ